MASCLDDTRILCLLEGNLTSAERSEVEAHLDGCEACRLLVGAAADNAPSSLSSHELTRGASVGRYLVLSLLGKGGMGWVYAAYDPDLDRRVAVKVLHPGSGSDGTNRLLTREARAMGKLSHPNVVQVYDVGEHDGELFVAMELVDGRSLDHWYRGEPKPPWRDILAAFIEAALGLAAAHARGLIHRDVKPSNILRGKDGRVRVADFGLATKGKGHGDSPPSSLAPLRSDARRAAAGVETLAETGVVVGTPIYMSPEQHEGKRATAASDQYSLCVALHEGLYGALPFPLPPNGGKAMVADIWAAKNQGPAAAPPAGRSVPRWVYPVVARGLSPCPEDRFPSMGALIAALREDPEARRRVRRWGGALGAIVLGIAVAAGLAVAGTDALQDPCGHPERELEGVWDGAVKERVRAVFERAGSASGEATATRVSTLLDTYAGEWTSMRGEVCQELRRAPERRDLLALRADCLERRRGRLKALSTVFADKPDPDVVERAVSAAAALSPIAYCADTDALRAPVRPPEDPATRALVASLHPRVDRLEALFSAGKYKDGLAYGEPLLEEVALVPYPPLRAQAQLAMGRLRGRLGEYEQAASLMRSAAACAAEGRDDVLVAIAWASLLSMVGDRQRRFDEAGVIRSLGPTVLARVQDPQALGLWSNSEGTVLYRMGRFAEAKASLERSLALRQKALGPNHPDVAASMNNLGLVLQEMEDYSAARAQHEGALTLREKAFGPEHPDVAMSLNNLGLVLFVAGEYPDALAADERAAATWEKSVGARHLDVATSLANAAMVLHAMGDLKRGRAAAEQSLTVAEKALGPQHPAVAYPLAVLGRILVAMGQLDAAQEPLERARTLWEKAGGSASGDLAAALLGLGELALARHKPAEAAALLERALGMHVSANRGDMQLALAEALWRTDRERARSLAEQARGKYERIGHQPGRARAARWLAEHPSRL